MTIEELKVKALELICAYCEDDYSWNVLDENAKRLYNEYNLLKCKYKEGDTVWVMEHDFIPCKAKVVTSSLCAGKAFYRLAEEGGRTVCGGWVAEYLLFTDRAEMLSYYRKMLDDYEHIR